MVANSPSSMSTSSYDKNKYNKDDNIFALLLRRMNPGFCLCGEPADNYVFDEDVKHDAIDQIMKGALMDIDTDMDTGENSTKANCAALLDSKISALKCLHEMSRVKDNRIAMVCTTKWELIISLANCLVIGENRRQDEASNFQLQQIRRLACLTLNNLSIPKENKMRMILGSNASLLVCNLTKVIRLQEPETAYLSCVCLMHLSSISGGVKPILTFSNSTETFIQVPNMGTHSIDPRVWEKNPLPSHQYSQNLTPLRRRRSSPDDSPYLDDPTSTLRSLECLMRDHQPFLMSKSFSLEGEAIRWTVGLLRNLSKENEHCRILSSTDIPVLVLGFLERTPHPVTTWAKDSLEEMTITFLEHLVRSPEGCKKLKEVGAIHVFRNISAGAGDTQPERKILSIMKSLE